MKRKWIKCLYNQPQLNFIFFGLKESSIQSTTLLLKPLITSNDIVLLQNVVVMVRLDDHGTLARLATPDLRVKINIDGNFLSLQRQRAIEMVRLLNSHFGVERDPHLKKKNKKGFRFI